MKSAQKLEYSEPTRTEESSRFDRMKGTVPPDGGWGWMVLGGTIVINVVSMGHCKSFGVYFKSFMEEFDASPTKISWLYSLQLFIFSFFSPFSSIFTQFISPRRVALAGSLMAFAALVISASVSNLELLYVSFGIIQGAAQTLMFTSGITVVAEYFHSYRGLANGLLMAGNALGGITMPLLVHYLLSKYDLRGCLLIMGSLSLSSCIGAMLWQPVKWHLKKLSYDEELEEAFVESLLRKDSCISCVSEKIVSEGENLIQNIIASNQQIKENKILPEKSSLQVTYKDNRSYRYASGPNLYLTENHLTIPNNRFTRGGSQPTIILNKDFCSCDRVNAGLKSLNVESKKIYGSRTSSFLNISSCSLGPTPNVFLKREHICASNQIPQIAVNDLVISENPSPWKISQWLRKFAIDKSIFNNNRFYFMTISLFFHALGYQGTYLFLPQRTTMLGLTEAQTASILSILAFSDLVGRIFCAWLSDFQLCPRQYLFICGMFLSGIMATFLPFCHTYSNLTLMTASFGFCCGSYIGLAIALFADVYCPEQVALAYSVSIVMGSSMSLGGGPLMCYILESTNSYVICQAILGSAQLAGAAVWLAEPLVTIFKSKKKNIFFQAQKIANL